MLRIAALTIISLCLASCQSSEPSKSGVIMNAPGVADRPPANHDRPAWDAMYGAPMSTCAAAVSPTLAGVTLADHVEFDISRLRRELDMLHAEPKLPACVEWANVLIAHGVSLGSLDASTAPDFRLRSEREDLANQVKRAIAGLQLAHLADQHRLLEALLAGAESSLAFGHANTPHWRFALTERWVRTLDGWMCRDRGLAERFDTRRAELSKRAPSARHRWGVVLATVRRDAEIRGGSPERVELTPVIDRLKKLHCDDWDACVDSLRVVLEEVKGSFDSSLLGQQLPFVPTQEDHLARTAQRSVNAVEDARRMVLVEDVLLRNIQQRYNPCHTSAGR